ncbi:ribosomal protein L7/L12 [Streptomyces sp. NPDC059467]|uniref:ribosomal protein L7/L12 n=1 Tax=Streptomyces sp. NPDC059467 TaxID=3346844 RepID=UPI00369DEA21
MLRTGEGRGEQWQLDVAQAVRRLTGLSLWHSRVLATQVPALVLDGMPQQAATAAVLALRDAGAQAETGQRSGDA